MAELFVATGAVMSATETPCGCRNSWPFDITNKYSSIVYLRLNNAASHLHPLGSLF